MVVFFFYLAKINTAAIVIIIANTTKATRQRLAHFSSALRIWERKTSFSASVFSGSQEPIVGSPSREGAEGGARRGEKRMNVPISQKGGNTK